MSQSIQLLLTSILQVPLERCEKDFTFIVNGQEYQTSSFIAQLLSPKICKILSSDPTINLISINTVNRGNFQTFLDLIKFDSTDIPDNELNFIGEIIEQLETDQININIIRDEITIDNALTYLSNDEHFHYFYKKQIKDEIEFVSKNFCEIEKTQQSTLLNLSFDTLKAIVSHPKLEIENEDQLLKFINVLYSNSNEYSDLYENIYFNNVETSSIEEFLSLFNFNDLTSSSWLSISQRLKQQPMIPRINENYEKRYKNKIINFCYDKEFDGIFNYFRNNSNIQEQVRITCSSTQNGDVQKVIQSDDPENQFFTANNANQWFCFEFLKNRIIPTNYTIRSDKWKQGEDHLRNWVIEGSENGSNWETIDKQENCPILNGYCFTHTFHINNNKEFKFIRIRQTGVTWENTNYLCFNSIEFFGKIV